MSRGVGRCVLLSVNTCWSLLLLYIVGFFNRAFLSLSLIADRGQGVVEHRKLYICTVDPLCVLISTHILSGDMTQNDDLVQKKADDHDVFGDEEDNTVGDDLVDNNSVHPQH